MHGRAHTGGRWSILLLIITLTLAPTLPTAATGQATLVKDLLPEMTFGPDIAASHFVRLGNRTFFFADDGSNGRELWRTDGTAVGTQLVRDMVVGSEGAFLTGTVNLNGTLFFLMATDDEYALWKSDGTAAGTVATRDLLPEPDNRAIQSLVVLNGALLITTEGANGGRRLWRSTGVPGGTTLVAKLQTMQRRLVVGHQLFFTQPDSTTSTYSLWVSNGTAAGTKRLTQFQSLPNNWVAWNGKLVLFVDGKLWQSDGTSAGTTPLIAGDFKQVVSAGSLLYLITIVHDDIYTFHTELWRSDGTAAGTVPLKRLGSADSYELTVAGNRLFFIDKASSGTAQALWKTDGTVASTQQIRLGYTSHLTALGGGVVFIGPDSTNDSALWQSDGTVAGTRLLKDLEPPSKGGWYTLIPSGDRVYIQAGDTLWESDGTAAGTVPLTTFLGPKGGLEDWFSYGLIDSAVVNQRHIFVANNNHELWASDGSTAGTQLLREFESSNYGMRSFTEFNDLAFYSDSQKRTLWRTDGTAAGTIELLDAGRLNDSFISMLVPLNDTLFFFSNSDETWLWRTDGTISGTVQLGKLTENFFWDVETYTRLNDMLLFTSSDDHAVGELWRSDGTPSGTFRLTTFPHIAPASSYRFLGALPQAMLLLVTTDTGRFELWHTNGTVAGTRKVVSLTGMGVGGGVVIGSVVYFPLQSGNQVQLWRSDGTTAGTAKVATLGTVEGDSFQGLLTTSAQIDDQLYAVFGAMSHSYLWKRSGPNTLTPIAAVPGMVSELSQLERTLVMDVTAAANGRELWVSDGTAVGTHILKDINPGPADATLTLPVNVGGTWLFIAEDPSGRALWATDGTTNGTQAIRAPGRLPRAYNPGTLQPFGSTQAIFSAHTPETGRELWITDGTVAGTRLFQDIAPGAGSSSPGGFWPIGDRLLIVANDGRSGKELWGLDLPIGRQAYLPLIRR